MEINSNERKKVCPRCHSGFSCCTENCWCDKLPQVMPFSKNEDCLCPDCLKIAIDNKINATA